MRAPVPACTGRLAIAAGLAMTLGAGLAPAAQAATAQAASRIPGAAPSALPHAVKLLYNQNNDYALGPVGALSDNFGNGYKPQTADDFAVPKGQIWTISRVDVNGYYIEDSAAPATVFFYKSAVNRQYGGYMPGAVVKKETLPVRRFGTLFMFSGITGVTLPAGRYWLSVQLHMKSTNGQWWWMTRTVQNGSPAEFENPGGATGVGSGTGCSTWYNFQTCYSTSGEPDLMFGLYGNSKSNHSCRRSRHVPGVREVVLLVSVRSWKDSPLGFCKWLPRYKWSWAAEFQEGVSSQEMVHSLEVPRPIPSRARSV